MQHFSNVIKKILNQIVALTKLMHFLRFKHDIVKALYQISIQITYLNVTGMIFLPWHMYLNWIILYYEIIKETLLDCHKLNRNYDSHDFCVLYILYLNKKYIENNVLWQRNDHLNNIRRYVNSMNYLVVLV